jgi:hypothetical protein
MDMIKRLVVLLVLGLPAAAQTTACADCFAVERLAPAVRARSEELLLKALDNESLYTLVGGMKAMSSGVKGLQFSVEKPDLREVEEIRQALSVWQCNGEIRATMHHFAAVHEGKRSADVAVFYLPKLGEVIREKAEFFARYGFTASADPMEVLTTIEQQEQPVRLRGQGYLFGYPDYAVDFFVAAFEEEQRTKQFVARKFLSIPTFTRPERGFVYAVAKDAEEREEDRVLRQRAEVILREYRRRREVYIGEGKLGAARLLRDWYDDGKGRCAAGQAGVRGAE